MRAIYRHLSIIIIALLTALCVTGCSMGKQDTYDESSIEQLRGKEKVLRWASLSAPSGEFNPLIKADDFDAYISDVIYEGLVALNPDQRHEAALAESWEVSEDLKSITFHLRDGVKWHDGEPFTAADVKFTYEFIADPKFTGISAAYISAIEGFKARRSGKAKALKGVEVIDDKTVRITTTEIYAPFIDNICCMVRIIPEHIWSKFRTEEVNRAAELLRNPVGTGPFKFKEYSPDRYTVVERNKDYWNGRAKLDKIVFQVVNPDTVIAQMLNGEFDYLELHSMDPDDIKLCKDGGFIVEEIPTTSYQLLVPNNQNPNINNKWVRQALAYGIDKKEIVDKVLHGYGSTGTQLYPPHFWAYPGTDNMNPYEYDPERARALLIEKAGWEYKSGKMYIDGKPAKFTLIYPIGNKARELSAPMIKENLKIIGIELELQRMDFATMLNKIGRKTPAAFDFCLVGLGLGSDPDPTSMLHSEYIYNGFNLSRYSNKELDRLLEEGLRHLGIEERKEIYREVVKIVNEEMPNIYLYNFNSGIIKAPNLKGKIENAFSFSYNAVNWDLE